MSPAENLSTFATGLLKGNVQVVQYYQIAKQKWDVFFKTHQDQPMSVWATWLTDEQISFFEHQCGGRSLGQEVMAWSGFGALYSTRVGFEDNLALAKKLATAFANSSCSVEVKGQAARAAVSFHLDEE